MKKVILLAMCVMLLFTSCVQKQLPNEENTVSPAAINTTSIPERSIIVKSNGNTSTAQYDSLVEYYKKLVNIRCADGFEEKYNNGELSLETPFSINVKYDSELDYRWHCMIAEMVSSVTVNDASFSCSFEDINNDGVLEAIWLKNDSFILAVFSTLNENVCLLDAFWPRYKCNDIKDGLFYMVASGGAYYTSFYVKEIVASSCTMNTAREFGTEEDQGTLSYYLVDNGEKKEIDENRFNALVRENGFQYQ